MAQQGGFYSGFQLPNVGAPTDLSREGLIANYGAQHQASRNANQDLFDRTARGFDRVLSSQQADLAAVGQGFRSRQRAVMRGLQGANEANERDIEQRFAQAGGNITQGLISSGLGNSTIAASMGLGVQRRMADALTRSRNDFAGRIADMRTQWGMQALQQQQQAAMANSGLAQQQLQFMMGNTNIAYPDMGSFAQMIAQAGHQSMNPFNLGGGGGGGGGTIFGDPSRPVGGPGPQSAAFYTSGSSDMGFAGSPYFASPATSAYGGPTAASFDPGYEAAGAFKGFGGGPVDAGYDKGPGFYQAPMPHEYDPAASYWGAVGDAYNS